jgi:large subunit ribosomal protein L18
MASGPRYSVKFRRRREGKTNYKSRLALVKSRKPRMVVRKTASCIIVQFVAFAPEGDRVLGTAISKELKDLGWKHSTKSVPAAYLTGYLASKRVVGKIPEAVLDIGLSGPRKGSRVFAALKGALDGGIKIPHGKEILPSEDRIKGKHIEDYRKQPIMQDFAAMKQAIENLKAGKIEKVPKAKGAPKGVPPVHRPAIAPPPKPVAQPPKPAVTPKPVAPPPKPVAQPPKPAVTPKPVAQPPKPVAQPPTPAVTPKPVAPPPKPVEKPADKKPPMDDMDALLAELTGKKAAAPPPKPAAPPPKPVETPKTSIEELLSKKKKEQDEKKEP